MPALLQQVKPYFVVVSLRRQDPEAALKMIDEIIPKLSAIDEELPWYYNQRALVMRSRKDYAAAEQALTTALRLNPNLVVSHLNLGVVYSDQGKLDAAIAEDLQALKLDPNFAVAHDNYGSHLRKQRKFAEAKPSSTVRWRSTAITRSRTKAWASSTATPGARPTPSPLSRRRCASTRGW